MDEVAENSDELMERYLEGEEISHAEIVTALKKGVTEGHLFPVTCGVATQNLGTNRLLEALVEDVPSPAMRGAVKALDADGNEIEIEPTEDGDPVAYVFKTTADPYTGRINMLRVYSGVLSSDSQVFNVTRQAKERIGQLATPLGKETSTVDELGAGRHRRGGEAPRDPAPATCWRPRTPAVSFPPLDLPAPVMAFAFEPKSKGDEEKAATRAPAPRGGGPDARRPPRPRDRRADHRRADPGPRRGDRRPDEAPLRRRDRAPPAAGAVPRDDPQARQGARPLQEADGRPRASSAIATSRSSRSRPAPVSSS